MFSRQLRTNVLRMASNNSKRFNSSITPVKTDLAPPAAASYSQAIRVNGFVYVSGQLPYSIEGKPLPGNPSIGEQAEQLIKNVSNVLEASNSSLNKIVKNTVFLTDMKSQFAEFNQVYAKFFNEHKPSRSCIAVKELPLGAPFEMESIAIEKEN